ncbi:MAG: hypothetical protein MZW92_14435 [Comamonadaceae bacterium]|nr:hypothetical protein [Comamonadaceae bacterium]
MRETLQLRRPPQAAAMRLTLADGRDGRTVAARAAPTRCARAGAAEPAVQRRQVQPPRRQRQRLRRDRRRRPRRADRRRHRPRDERRADRASCSSRSAAPAVERAGIPGTGHRPVLQQVRRRGDGRAHRRRERSRRAQHVQLRARRRAGRRRGRLTRAGACAPGRPGGHRSL